MEKQNKEGDNSNNQVLQIEDHLEKLEQNSMNSTSCDDIESQYSLKLNQKKAALRLPGVRIEKGGVHFAVVLPADKPLELLLYRRGENEPAVTFPFPKEDRVGRVAYIYVENLNPNEWEYNYACDGKVFQDPYARKICGREEWGEKPAQIKCGFMEREFNWEEERRPQISYEDTIIYRMHVRGFTKHPSARVRNKGTFAGIIEKIPYLKKLGITLIELLPSYEFDEILMPECMAYVHAKADIEGRVPVNYWGYTQGQYFAPKASYSAAAKRKGKKDSCWEFKELVKQLHRAGIEIGMEFYFIKGTTAEFILDCLRYWTIEYHIDAFHINSDVSPMTLIAQDPLLSTTKLFGNGWNIEEIYGQNEPFGGKNLAEYNDGFLVDARRFLKGDEDQVQTFLYRISHNPEKHAVVNYIANHDSLTLFDMVTYEQKHNQANGEGNRDGNSYNFSWNCGVEGETKRKKVLDIRSQQIKNALILVFLSQGTPMILAGDEMGRTKKGNNNAYCQDNEISWLNWNMTRRSQEIFEFTKALIQFRKEHRILHMPKQLKMMNYGAVTCPDVSFHSNRAWYPQIDAYSRYIGVMYCGAYTKYLREPEDDTIYIAYNTHWEEHKFALPNLPKGKNWRIVIHTACDQTPYFKDGEQILSDQRTILVPPRSVCVLIGK